MSTPLAPTSRGGRSAVPGPHAAPAAHVGCAFAISGPVEGDRLRCAWDAAVRRYVALPPDGAGADGRDAAAHQLRTVDVSPLPASEHPLRVQRQARRLARQPVGAAAGPLVRAVVIRRGPCDHVLLVTADPRVADEARLHAVAVAAAREHDRLDGTPDGDTPQPPTPVRTIAAASGTQTGDVAAAGVLVALSRLTRRRVVDAALRVVAPGPPGAGVPLPTAVHLRLEVDPAQPLAAAADEVARQGRAAATPAPAGAPDLVLVVDERSPDDMAPLSSPASPRHWAPLAVDLTPGTTVELHIRTAGAARVEARGDAHVHDVAAGVLADAATALLDAAASRPDRPAGTLPLLSPYDRRRIVVDRNRTVARYPRDALVHELVSDRALQSPDAPAVACGLTRLTYGELEHRADRLARHLRGLGVRRGSFVGITAERSAESVVGLLAILKAGGAYVPIDTRQPESRMRYVLGDAGAAIVLTGRAGASRLPRDGLTPVDLDAPSTWQEPPSATEPPWGGDADQLAYLLYTSGSTGRPKGVLVPHRQLVNSTTARWGFGRRSPGTYLLLVPLTFDAAAQGLYWTLFRGGRLVVANDHQIRDVALLAALVAAEGVTHLNWVPSTYRVLLDHGAAPLRSLRDVSLGGEALPAGVALAHLRHLPDTALYNDYGPTEATVWSTAHRCDDVPDEPLVPIGRPIQNTQVYVLDPALELVPDGGVGELHIGGDGVALGYHGRPDLTAERFVPDPFAPRPGARMYRTGDLVRYGEDGLLRFVGRLDDQVKVRGHRVEPADVEAALLEHADVIEAAVVATPEQDTHALVAHVVWRSRPDDRIEAFVRDRVPPHMVPARFVASDRLPRTAHGKVARAALASSGDGGPRSQWSAAVDALPGTEVDRLLSNMLTDGDGPA